MFRMIIKPSNAIETFYSVAMWAVFFLISLSTAQAATLNLAWDASSGATGYRVYQAQTDETAVNLTTSHVTDSSPLAATSTTTTATISNLLDGKTYYFAVKAYNGTSVSGFSNEVGKTFTAVALAPVASFSASPTTGVAPLAVNFTDSSTGNITSRSWVFGDGTTSTAQNPTKTYTTAGTYAVQLTVTGPGGSNAATKTLSVTAPAVTAPVASFSASPVSGTAPLLVTFNDTSTGSVASRSWVFGDGTTSTAKTVVKTYNTVGTYNATLTVTNSGRSSSSTASKSISVTAAPPVANFSASLTSGIAPLAVTFTNTSTGTGPLTYAWTFGDGGASTTQNPAYTYTKAGTYTVSLTATGPTGTKNAKTLTGYITVSAASAGGGLVAAYNFEEASGATVVDASGKGHHGTLSGPTRTPSGKFGKDLSFDGVSNWVTVNDSAALDLTTGMTLEAWVYPTTISGNRTVLVKENAPGNSVYYLYANTSDDSLNTPLGGGVFAGQYQFTHGGSMLATNAWTHVAVTYDGATERLYVNGSQVASKAQTGSMGASSGALRIGGNSLWGEYFKGRIDEIRIYNRALSATEIQTDRNTAVATSSPPKLLLGNQTVGSVADSIPQGMAASFQTTASVTGQVTSLPVYVDAGSASTQLIAGLYQDSNGHPGALLAQGTLSSPVAGTWNKVLLPATVVNAGTTYWVAVLSPNGMLKFRDKVGSTARPSETSTSTTLTTLPSTWTTGTLSTGGPLSGYGAGY